MSSMLSSQGVVLATAMAVSGATVILLAFRLPKSFPTTQCPIAQTPQSSIRVLRSCISSEVSKREKKKNKKRVHFAEDVVDPNKDGDECRKKHSVIRSSSNTSLALPMKLKEKNVSNCETMPANRVALYNGILRDRLVHRLASY